MKFTVLLSAIIIAGSINPEGAKQILLYKFNPILIIVLLVLLFCSEYYPFIFKLIKKGPHK